VPATPCDAEIKVNCLHNIYMAFPAKTTPGPVVDSRGAAPPLAQNFFRKPPFSVLNSYSSFCAFAINEERAKKWSSALPPFSNFFGSATDQGSFQGKCVGTPFLLLVFKNALWTALRTIFRQKMHSIV